MSISPYNFSICEGEYSEDALLERLGEGIYITELKGLHAGADASTGDFSIESEGFAVRGGKKAEPVRSFTVAGNFFELLMNIDSLSDKVKWAIPTDFCIFGSPDVLIKDISVAGK
jgi:PmbA protein